jgi:hypothetical protein
MLKPVRRVQLKVGIIQTRTRDRAPRVSRLDRLPAPPLSDYTAACPQHALDGLRPLSHLTTQDPMMAIQCPCTLHHRTVS